MLTEPTVGFLLGAAGKGAYDRVRRELRRVVTRPAPLMTALLSAALAVSASAPAEAKPAFAVTQAGDQLVRFDTTDPGGVSITPITGLLAGDSVIDLDVRPWNDTLYALAGNGTTARLYRLVIGRTVGPLTGVGPVATLLSATPTGGNMNFAGFSGALDFDPVNDRARVISPSGQSYRVHPDTGVPTLETAVSAAASIVGSAFSNNFSAPTSATFYGLDRLNGGRLVTIGTPNGNDGGASGAIAAIGPLGQTVDDLSGMDILPNSGIAYGLLPAADGIRSALSRIDLVTGTATIVGNVGAPGPGGMGRVKGLAVFARASKIYGVNTNNQLVIFLSAVPADLRKADGAAGGTARPITGLTGNVVAMDVRPSTGVLYALTDTNQLFTIDPSPVDPAPAVATPVGTLTIALTSAGVGMSFSEGASEHIRVVTASGQNLRIEPATALTTADTALNGASTSLSGLFTFATGYFGIDTAADFLRRFDAPSGSVNTGGSLGLDTSDFAAIDLALGDWSLFASFTAPAGLTSGFYEIRDDVFISGATTPTLYSIGTVGGGAPLRAMAVAPIGYARLVTPAPPLAITETPGMGPGVPVPITLERVAGSDGPLSVEMRTWSGDAQDGPDFTGVRVTHTFLPGAPQTANTVAAFVTDDFLIEPDEQFHIGTSALTLLPVVLPDVTQPTATVTIKDDDAAFTPTIQVTSPTTAGTYEANSLFIALSGVTTDPDGSVERVEWATNHGASGLAWLGSAAGVGQPADWTVNVVPLVVGQNIITLTAVDNDAAATGRRGSTTLIVNVSELTYFMAEGATGFFNLDILIANPSSIPANVEVEFFDEQGAVPGVQAFQVPANSRRTLTVNDLPGMDSRAVSTIVRSKNAVPLIVERTMEWSRSERYASATDHATDGAAIKWYFAEGAQGAFNTYLLLVNPQAGANVAHVRYLRDNESVVTVDYPLLGFQRFTVDISNTVDFPAHADLQGRVFGMEVTFNQPGVAERAMYFGFPPLWRGGHESAGVNLPSNTWFLAEGATGFFQTYVLLANPSAVDAGVQVQYLLPGGGTVDQPNFTLKAGQRTSIDIASVHPNLAQTAVSTAIQASVPIVVERAQYWPSGAFENWQEAHNSFGITQPGTVWGLAEGRVGGERGYSTYILLANPGGLAVSGTVRFLRENGPPVTKTFSIHPHGRFTIFGEDLAVPELVDENFGAVITTDYPIVVERAMYSNALGVTWQAGSNATATRLPAILP